jgi:hypothetical protein
VTERDTLFVLRPGFLDQGKRWFCPYSAQVIGLLDYYPEVRDSLEIVELDFAKPRQPIVDLVGPDHQSVPLLVLHESATPDDTGVPIGVAQGRRYVEKTIDILRYLARTRGTPDPH